MTHKKVICRRLIPALTLCAALAVPVSGASLTVCAAESISYAEQAGFLEEHSIGLAGDFNNWGAWGNSDIPLWDDDFDGIYQAGFSYERGECRFTVRADRDWQYSWGDYDPVKGQTFKSDYEPKINITSDYACVAVRFDTNGDADLWSLKYEIVDGFMENNSFPDTDIIQIGQSVKIDCAVENGSGSIQYAVFYQEPDSDDWCSYLPYAARSRVVFTPDKTGYYTVRICAKDSKGYTSARDITLTVLPPLTIVSSINAAEVWTGDEVTVHCSSQNGIGEKLYALLYREPGSSKWKAAADYSILDTHSFRPTRAGEYHFRIRVKDDAGNTDADDYTVMVRSNALVNTSSLSADRVMAGDPVTVFCASENGAGAKRYALLYQEPNSTKWKTASAYSDREIIVFTPKLAGDYTLRVKVTDENGAVSAKNLRLTAEQGLLNTSYLDRNDIVLGESVTVCCSADNGADGKKFMVLYREPDSTAWKTLSAYSEQSEVNFRPKKHGAYTVRVKVMDEEGRTDAKNLQLYVGAPLKNTSVLENESIRRGDSAVIICSAEGGKGDRLYAAYYKKSSASGWTKARGYDTSEIISITPGAAVPYDIRVYAKDSSGRVSAAVLSLNVTG